jgi:hypothetical protein
VATNTTNLRDIPLKATANSNRLNIKATPSSRTIHHRMAATMTKDLPHQPERTVSVPLNTAAFRWVFKANSTAHMMQATHREIRDTSKISAVSQSALVNILTAFNSGAPGAQPGGQAGHDAYAQNQAYQQSLASGQHYQQQPPYDANAPRQEQQFSPQSSDPNAPNYDPNAPPMAEGERGLLGSIGGGVAGHVLGKKAGHGFLGTVGGGILGSLAEDFLKDSKKKHHHSHQGSSSWGGSRY